MTTLRAPIIVLLSTLLACGGGGNKGVPAGSDAATDAALDAAAGTSCPTAYQRVTAATAGHELAVAYQEHIPTPREKALAAALWATLIRGTRDGQIDQALFERLVTASTWATIPTSYPTAFRTCTAALTSPAPSANSRAIISDPFQCTDDCLISLNDVTALLVEPLVNGLKLLGGISKVYGDSLQMTDALKSLLTDPATAGQPIEEAAVTAISQDNADALLSTIFDAIGQSLAITAAVVELGGAAEIAAVIGAAGAIIGLGVYASKLTALAARINACRDWKAKNCKCMGPTCGCADLGASARGVMCCAQGGPATGGGWYVNTASPICCVLNRAEYSKHTEMCYTPPDKAPGRCPSCSSDTDCCDRLGAPGDIDQCVGGRCCGPDGPARPNTMTMVDVSCCSGVRYLLNTPSRQCAPAP